MYLSYLTMGIVLSTTWTYFSKFPNDKWRFKALVILCVSMCIAETIGSGRRRRPCTHLSLKPTDIFAGIWSYDWAVANYGIYTFSLLVSCTFPLTFFPLHVSLSPA
ncbi:hypothetical protein BT96DRAFT_39777 [Gymnopus androsaceus JB14]|uniref:Uncharacterized protein n=1 Tax=Gymnopus androsaceus JB14 TaxID=1447944 RepID=A0A6A4GDN9_9AGAR|nr:hypothetical protein BT96DRAFT_39777 [Gymnopus androsaceus JB14]